MCYVVLPSMDQGGTPDVVEHVGSDGAPSRAPARLVRELDIIEHADSEHAQDVQGLAREPSRGNEAPNRDDSL